MIYKLYKIRYTGDLPSKEISDGFNKIYEANDVKDVGSWVEASDKKVLYFIKGYRDEEHYSSFVSEMKENAEYQELAKQIADSQGDAEVVTLIDYLESLQ